MLNQTLIDEFRAIHRDGRTGSLAIDRDGVTLRFFFDGGQLILMDYGEDKELLQLRQLRAYHKIGPEAEMMVAQVHRSKGVAVRDYLIQQRLVAAEEADGVARTLVEDTLCNLFGTQHDALRFEPGGRLADYDLDRSAVKLRIQTDVLVEMVQGRVQERDAVYEAIPDWGCTFGLVEDMPASDALNDAERHVLHFVDGRKNVQTIASSLRDSCLNTACYLQSLYLQGFVKPVTPSSGSGVRVAIDDQPAEAPAPVASAPRLDEQPIAIGEGTRSVSPAVMMGDAPARPMRRMIEEAPRRSKAPMVILSVILLLVALLAWLIIAGQQRQSVFVGLQSAIAEAAAEGEWYQANQALLDARDQAGSDSVLQDQLDGFVEQHRRNMGIRLDQITSHLDQGRLNEALPLLAALPAAAGLVIDLWDEDLTERLEAQRARSRALSQQREREALALADRVQVLLDAAAVSDAMQLVDASPDIAGPSREVLREWRLTTLNKARNSRLPVGERASLLEQIRASRPSDRILGDITNYERELTLVRQRLDEDLVAIEAILTSGDTRTVLERLDQIAEIAAGGVWAGRIEALRRSARDLDAQIEARLHAVPSLVRSARDAATLAEAQTGLQELLTRLPAMHAAARVQAAMDALARVQNSLTQPDAEAQARVLEAALPELPAGDLYQAFERRINEIRSIETLAQSELERARAQRSAGDLDGARGLLEAMLARPDMARTRVATAAATEIEAIDREILRRRDQLGALREAMLADDVARVSQLAAGLALPRLPLLIRSSPAGVDVLRGDESLGVTPLLVDDLSAERVQVVFTLRAEGYEPVRVPATAAEGGWRISVALERQAFVELDLGHDLTGRPAAIGDELWLSSSRHVVAVDQDGSLRRFATAGGSSIVARPLNQPIYAPAIELAGAVYLATRDRLALRLTANELQRLPMGAGTDLAPARYESPVVVDRELLISAGVDGRLEAVDVRSATSHWQGQPGIPFVAAPIIIDDRVLAVRRDGTVVVRMADTGDLRPGLSLGETILAAWPADGGLAMISTARLLHWDGRGPLLAEALPQPAIRAEQDIYLAQNRTVLVHHDGAWGEVGRLLPAAGEPQSLLRWGEQGVVITASTARILGPRPFTVSARTELMAPAVLGGNLALVTADGLVQFFSP